MNRLPCDSGNRKPQALKHESHQKAVLRTIVLLVGLNGLMACGSKHPGFPSSVIQQPTALDLYPSQDNDRLYVMVTSVGNQSASLPVVFDTGSSGVALNALAIFPSSIVTSSGFVIPAGQESITYNGVTVTNLVGTRPYGGSQGTTEHGNLGFAQVSFGDSSGQLTTAIMPVFFYYSIEETATGEPQAPQHKQGWFGANGAADKIYATTPVEGAPNSLPCSMSSQADCYLVSALKYLYYAPPCHAGFMLTPFPLQPCDIAVADSCLPAPMLTVGLNDELESGFSQVTLTCPQGDYSGPDIIVGLEVCADQVPFTTVSVTLPRQPPVTVTLNQSVLFDSGNPAADIEDESGNLPSPLPSNTSVEVIPPSGFTYSYEAQESGVTKTTVGNASTGFGIYYFTQHSFFIDFTSNVEGWK
jgi:hypothetical protein